MSPAVLESLDVAIVGWRSWRWAPHRERLVSCVWSTTWEPFERLEAEEIGAPLHVSADVSMSSPAGVHAWKTCADLDRIIKFDPGMITVWGEVSLWGRVVEAVDGWKAQYAYPLSLLLLPADKSHAARIAGTYGVEARAMAV